MEGAQKYVRAKIYTNKGTPSRHMHQVGRKNGAHRKFMVYVSVSR